MMIKLEKKVTNYKNIMNNLMIILIVWKNPLFTATFVVFTKNYTLSCMYIGMFTPPFHARMAWSGSQGGREEEEDRIRRRKIGLGGGR